MANKLFSRSKQSVTALVSSIHCTPPLGSFQFNLHTCTLVGGPNLNHRLDTKLVIMALGYDKAQP